VERKRTGPTGKERETETQTERGEVLEAG